MTGIDELPINETVSTPRSKSIDTTIDLPYIEAGRLIYYPAIVGADSGGIDIIISKAIDISEFGDSVSDSKIVVLFNNIMIMTIILYAMSKLEKIVTKTKGKRQVIEEYYDETELTIAQRTKFEINDEWYNIIHDRACVEWHNMCGDIDNGNISNITITMHDAKEFSLKTSKKYVYEKDHKRTIDATTIFEECLLIIQQNKREQDYVNKNGVIIDYKL